jgi:hypothetical protein
MLLSLINKIVNSDEGPWHARRKALTDVASEDDVVSLAEFSAWFAYDDLGNLSTPTEEPPK